ncbi:unnamed protein product, partial [Prorocentrum cordatum]
MPQLGALGEQLCTVLGFKWFGTLFTTGLPAEVAVVAWGLIVRDGLAALLPLALGVCALALEPRLQPAALEAADEDPEDALGRVQRQLPADAALLLPPDAAALPPAAAAAQAAGRVARAAERFACTPEVLEGLLEGYRRRHPEEASELGADFSFCLSRARGQPDGLLRFHAQQRASAEQSTRRGRARYARAPDRAAAGARARALVRLAVFGRFRWFSAVFLPW